MSFVSHVNNTCFISPALKNSPATPNKNPTAPAQPSPGVVTKISNRQPVESVTYPAPAPKKVSLSDVAVGAIVSTVGGVVGASVGKYAAAKYENTLGMRVVGGVVGGAMGASFTPGNVFEVVGVRSDAAFIGSACALVAAAMHTIARPQQAQNGINPAFAALPAA